MFHKLFSIVVLLLTSVTAGIVVSEGYSAGNQITGEYDKYIDYYTYPKYNFKYSVNDFHTGDYKTQQEHRDGDVVKGYYSVLEADGTIRTVHYTADKLNGFNAIVSKSGQPLKKDGSF